MIKAFVKHFTNHPGTEIPYTLHKFSGGEMHVKIDESYSGTEIRFYSECQVEAKICNSDDLMVLLLLVDALRRLHIKISTLWLPYIPYGRQDRVCNRGESLSIKVFADIINNLNMPRVKVIDPHSYVSTALINNCENWSELEHRNVLGRFFTDSFGAQECVFVAPDLGAEKKLSKLIPEDKSLLAISKTRSPSGDVTCTSLNIVRTAAAGKLYEAKNIVFIDDICDGGATFLKAHDFLAPSFPKAEFHLFVTHGIFSNGVGGLKARFKTIGCTNSFSETYPTGVKVYDYKS